LKPDDGLFVPKKIDVLTRLFDGMGRAKRAPERQKPSAMGGLFGIWLRGQNLLITCDRRSHPMICSKLFFPLAVANYFGPQRSRKTSVGNHQARQ
jgi:hypothetical protein